VPMSEPCVKSEAEAEAASSSSLASSSIVITPSAMSVKGGKEDVVASSTAPAPNPSDPSLILSPSNHDKHTNTMAAAEATRGPRGTLDSDDSAAVLRRCAAQLSPDRFDRLSGALLRYYLGVSGSDDVVRSVADIGAGAGAVVGAGAGSESAGACDSTKGMAGDRSPLMAELQLLLQS
jgi:hypothetical protein